MGCSKLRAAVLKADPKRCELFQKEPIYSRHGKAELAAPGAAAAAASQPRARGHAELRRAQVRLSGLIWGFVDISHQVWTAWENRMVSMASRVWLPPCKWQLGSPPVWYAFIGLYGMASLGIMGQDHPYLKKHNSPDRGVAYYSKNWLLRKRSK